MTDNEKLPPIIRVGDDITMFHGSDRTCYFVTEVLGDNHLKVREYHVCADQSKDCGVGHQNWLFFKTLSEMNRYLNSCHLILDGAEIRYGEDVEEPEDVEIKFVKGRWMRVRRYTIAGLRKAMRNGLGSLYACRLTEREHQRMMDGNEVVKYSPFGDIAFGRRDYYYEWSI